MIFKYLYIKFAFFYRLSFMAKSKYFYCYYLIQFPCPAFGLEAWLVAWFKLLLLPVNKFLSQDIRKETTTEPWNCRKLFTMADKMNSLYLSSIRILVCQIWQRIPPSQQHLGTPPKIYQRSNNFALHGTLLNQQWANI